MQKLFKTKIFYYIFMIWVGLDLFNQLLNLSQSTSFLSLQILKGIMLVICIGSFLCFFFDFKVNHSVFKVYLYLKMIIFPLFWLIYMAKETIFYGISIEDRFSAEFLFLMIFNLLVGIILLIFYRKYRKITHFQLQKMEIAKPFVHYFLHFIFPVVIALVFYKKDWKKVYVILLATILVDLDHLLATPIFDPNRCSVGFHLLHSYSAVAVYFLGSIFLKGYYRVAAVGLIFHMFTDWQDYYFYH